MSFFKEPVLTASAFSTMAFIDRWARGKGERWIGYVERFFERKQRQGIVGGRVFGETTYWHDRDDNPDNDHKFFNENRATSIRMWNYQELVNRARPKRLTVHNQKCILKLIELARKHSFKIDYCSDATLKHSPGVGWNVIGHCIRQTAHYLNAIHTAAWDDEVMGHPTNQVINDKIRKRFENVVGPIDHLFIHETHNEEDAHSRGAWQRDNLTREQALREVNLQLSRHDRLEQWPAGNVGVSHGGRDDIEYAVGPKGADVVRVHPSRSGEWSAVGDRFDHLNKYHAHIYLSETKHFVDRSMRYTIDDGWFRPESSTSNEKRLLRFEQDAMAKGYSFCRHSLVNMANGYWVDGDEVEEMPYDSLERATMGEPPPPPPPPEPKWIAHDIRGILKIFGLTVPIEGDIELSDG